MEPEPRDKGIRPGLFEGAAAEGLLQICCGLHGSTREEMLQRVGEAQIDWDLRMQFGTFSLF